jgi:hypothetical protein
MGPIGGRRRAPHGQRPARRLVRLDEQRRSPRSPSLPRRGDSSPSCRSPTWTGRSRSGCRDSPGTATTPELFGPGRARVRPGDDHRYAPTLRPMRRQLHTHAVAGSDRVEACLRGGDGRTMTALSQALPTTHLVRPADHIRIARLRPEAERGPARRFRRLPKPHVVLDAANQQRHVPSTGSPMVIAPWRGDGSPARLVTADRRAQRPQWTCRADCGDWPCPTARKLFADISPGRGSRSHGTHAATHGHRRHRPRRLRRLVVVPPVRRMDAGAGRACRVCGRPGHDITPGVPPRLLPWHSDHVRPGSPSADADP